MQLGSEKCLVKTVLGSSFWLFQRFSEQIPSAYQHSSCLEKFALIYYYFFKGFTCTLECPVDIIFSSRRVYFSLA